MASSADLVRQRACFRRLAGALLNAAAAVAAAGTCAVSGSTVNASESGMFLLQTSRANARSVRAEPEVEELSTDAGSLPEVDLMVVVPSHASLDVEQRMAIRETWAQYLNESVNCTPCQEDNLTVKLLFVVGQEGNSETTEAEREKFNDMGILVDFRQSSSGKNLAERTQRSIRYALEHFKFKLLLKVDTDSWVFFDRLIPFLEHNALFDLNASMPGLYAGNFRQGTNVKADNTEGKRYSEFTGSTMYPMHAKGAGYILSPDLCEFIAGMGANTEDMSGAPQWGEDYGWAPVPRLFNLPSEDISVGFWLEAVNHTKLSMPVSVHNSACNSELWPDSDLVIDHSVGPQEMRQRWASYLATGDVCPPSAGDEEESSGEAIFSYRRDDYDRPLIPRRLSPMVSRNQSGGPNILRG